MPLILNRAITKINKVRFFERIMRKGVPLNPHHVWVYSTSQSRIQANQFLIKL